MKVIQINAVFGEGSTGVIVQDIHKELKKRNYESFVFGSIIGEKAEDKECFSQIGNYFDHKIHAFLRRLGQNQGWHSKFATKELCKKISCFEPDVVHLHNLHSNYINIPILLKYLGKNDIPTVITLHDSWFYTGYCTYYFKHDNCQQWQNGCKNCPAVSKPYKKRVESMFSQKGVLYKNIKSLAVRGVSKWTADDARNSILSCTPDIDYIYNWIDTDVFYSRQNKIEVYEKYGLDKNKKLILGVAQSWSERKGLQEVIKISEKFKEEAVVVLVGENSAVTQTDSLKAIGFTTNKEALIDLYSAADVFVNPSRMETFGLVTAEAMACGAPVVAYDNTGSSELVPERCGFLAEDGNIQAFIDFVEKVLSEGKQKYSESCVEWVNSAFNKNTQIKKYISLYEDLMKK